MALSFAMIRGDRIFEFETVGTRSIQIENDQAGQSDYFGEGSDGVRVVDGPSLDAKLHAINLFP